MPGLYTTEPPQRFPEKPDLLGLHKSKALHVQGMMQPPTCCWEPTEDGSQGRVAAPVQRLLPGALGKAGAIRSRPHNELPDPGCSATLHASTPQQPERFWGQNQPSVLVCLPSRYPCSEPKASLA